MLPLLFLSSSSSPPLPPPSPPLSLTLSLSAGSPRIPLHQAVTSFFSYFCLPHPHLVFLKNFRISNRYREINPPKKRGFRKPAIVSSIPKPFPLFLNLKLELNSTRGWKNTTLSRQTSPKSRRDDPKNFFTPRQLLEPQPDPTSRSRDMETP